MVDQKDLSCGSGIISVADVVSNDVFLGMLGVISNTGKELGLSKTVPAGRFFCLLQHGVIDVTDSLLESWILTFYCIA